MLWAYLEPKNRNAVRTTLKSAGMLDQLCAKYHACEGDSIPDSVAIRN